MDLVSNGVRSELMEKLIKEKKIAREYQERKHNDWNENYELSRYKTKTNRLTQRQAVNIPIMKETEKTLLATIDDPPTVEFKDKGGDRQKEIYFQEIWNSKFKKNKFEWKDVVDKKNVLRYGLSTKMLNICDDGVDIDVLDVFDVLYDPLMNPIDTETARFIVRQNIFKSLREILADDRYTTKGKEDLKIWESSKDGLVQDSKNKEEWEKKLERLKSMGVDSHEFPLFAGGDVMVNLTEHYTKVWNAKKKEFEKRVVVYANDTIELLNETLMDLIGVDFWPIVMWMEDPETNDVYPDAIDDLVRTPNKVMNVWYSQMVESRTLRNFQMHWYDATNQGYVPQTYEPGPGRMLPAPGDPYKTIMPVEISGLDETLNALEYLTKIVERGTGATSIDKGVSEGAEETLGEVKILVGKSQERSIAMTKFYRASWYETAYKWAEMMHANPPKKIDLAKIGQDGTMYSRPVYPSDWKSETGYEPQVSSSSEQEQEDIKSVQKMQFVMQMFPNNMALRKIAQKRTLDIINLTPEEQREIQEEEDKLAEMVGMQGTQQPQAPTQQPQAPSQGMGEIQDKMMQLQALQGQNG